jgi:hypothetical protein
MSVTINASLTSGAIISSDTSGSLQLQTNSGTTALTINTSQQVGIGTTSPVSTLHVQQSSNNYFTLQRTGASGSGQFGINIETNAQTTFSYDSGAPLVFGTATTPATGSGFTERMRLTSAGNLGLGTSSPSKQLSIRSSSTDTGLTIGAGSNANNLDIDFLNSVDGLSGRIRYYPNSGYMDFYTSGSQQVRIDSSGNLGVGTASAYASVAIYVGTNTNGATSGGGIGLNGGTTADIDIGHASGTSSGTNYQRYIYNGSVIGSITQNGTTQVAYNTSSDYRLKNTIESMTGALAKVAQLKPVTYKWNADNSDGEGFIAHELAEVVPHAVTGEKDAVDAEGNPVYQGIDTSFLVATLTAAIQELSAELNALKLKVGG